MTKNEPMNEDVEHALRNHLAIIRGFAELLVASLSPGDERREQAADILNAAIEAIKVLDRASAHSSEE